MRLINRCIIALLLLTVALVYSPSVSAYPDQEKAQISLTGVTAQAVQMYLTTDNRYLYLGYSNKVKVADMGTFDLRAAAYQPYDFGSSAEYSGVVGGLALSNTRLYVSKDDGKMLRFEFSDLTAEPTQVTIASGTELGKMAITSLKTKIYIVDKDNNNILVYTIAAATTSTITISPSVSGASILDMILVPSVSGGNDYIYVSTNKGLVYVIVDGSATAAEAVVADNTDNLVALAAHSNKDYIYCINSSDKSVLVLNPTTLAVQDTVDLIIHQSGSEITYNESPTGIASTVVTNPTSRYTFVSGLSGVSVIDGNNNLIDVDTADTHDHTPIPISGERYGPLIAGSGGYLYMSNSDGSISVISANPYVTVSSVAYSSGGSSMGVGESATITFQSDEAGTYKTLIGGSIDQSGAADADSDGTGSVTAATDATVTVSYDTNASSLVEGANTVFIFVTDSTSDVGRRGTTVTVDTPPPAVTVNSAGFGNGRIYINFVRLTESDMSYYNIYVSTDADAVVNRTVTPTRISQPSSGTTVSAEISGLSNDTLYYASIEAVDAGGNVGPLTTTFANGSRITGTPEQTVGPVEKMGETGGCSLAVTSGALEIERSGDWKILGLGCLGLVFLLGILGSMRGILRVVIPRPAKNPPIRITPAALAYTKFLRCARDKRILLILILSILSLIPLTLHAEEASPQWWSTELKGGFWMPTDSTMKQFFDPCCNMVGMVEQGFLYQSKYGVELGVGVMIENGTAVGATSGAASQDRFNLLLLPMETSLVFRADFKENQIIVPYVKFGFDYVYYRENLKGDVTQGLKTGLHTAGGIQILLDMIDSGTQSAMEEDYGINDVYFTLEGRYSWIDSFGGTGLNLSNLLFSFGLLFEY